MTDLSPQAQAVLDAFTGNDTIHGFHLMTPRLAAALRAAVEQCTYRDAWEDKFLSAERILTVAAELEALPND